MIAFKPDLPFLMTLAAFFCDSGSMTLLSQQTLRKHFSMFSSTRLIGIAHVFYGYQTLTMLIVLSSSIALR